MGQRDGAGLSKKNVLVVIEKSLPKRRKRRQLLIYVSEPALQKILQKHMGSMINDRS